MRKIIGIHMSVCAKGRGKKVILTSERERELRSEVERDRGPRASDSFLTELESPCTYRQ